jgi:hypothetical protein
MSDQPAEDRLQSQPPRPPLPAPLVAPVPAAPLPLPARAPNVLDYRIDWRLVLGCGALVLLALGLFASFLRQEARATRRAGRTTASPPRASPPRRVKDFNARVDAGLGDQFARYDAISLVYYGDDDLRGCQVTIDVLYEDTRKAQVKRLWAVWAPGETNRVSLPARGFRVEYVHLSGTASLGGKPVTISASWEMTRKR